MRYGNAALSLFGNQIVQPEAVLALSSGRMIVACAYKLDRRKASTEVMSSPHVPRMSPGGPPVRYLGS